MKEIKLLLLLTCFSCVCAIQDGYGFSIYKPAIEKERNEALKYLRAAEFVKLSAKEFGSITGKHMNVWNRLAFKLLQENMKHELKKNPNLRVLDYYTSKKRASAFNILHWILIVLGL